MAECFFQLLFCRCLMSALIVGLVKSKTCWDSTWYNSSSPAAHGGSDFEAVNMTVLNTMCPDGGPVVAAHYKEEKGEPFRGFKNDTGNHYVANCTVENGLQCHPYTSTVGASCADFAIQYGCNCPTTTSTSTTTAAAATTITTVQPKLTSGTNITTSFQIRSALVMSAKTSPPPPPKTTTTSIPLKSASAKRTTTMFPTGRALLLSLTTKTTTTTTKPNSESASATRTTMLPTRRALLLSLTTKTTTTTTKPTSESASATRATVFQTGAALLLSATTYLYSSTRVANSKAENNTVLEKWKITDAECPSAKLQIGTWCVTWWIPLLVVSGSLFAINIVVSVCLYKASIAQPTRKSQINPLS